MTQTYKIMYTSGVTWEYIGTLIGAKRIATKHQTFEQFKTLSNIVIFDENGKIVAYKNQYNWIKQ
jgi:hypothetical protein